MRVHARRFAAVVVVAAVSVGGLSQGRTEPTSGLDLASIDRSVRPQDDLYRFANGIWLSTTEIPPDRVSYGTFTELADRVEVDLRRLIESLDSSVGEARKIRDLYDSMVDPDRGPSRGVDRLREELARIDAVDSTQALARQIGRVSSFGEGSPFATSAGLSADNPSAIVVTVTQGGTLLPERRYYLSDGEYERSVRRQYVEYLTKVFTLTGRPNAARDAASVLELETTLARAQVPAERARSGIDARTFKLHNLPAEIPGFHWRDWARTQGFDLVSAIVLEQPDFFRAFASAVSGVPLDAWKAWLAARYVTASSIYASEELSRARFDFFGRVLSGQQAPREGWQQGVSLVNRYLGDALGRLYVQRHFPERSRQRVRAMVRTVVTAFRQAVDEAEWMSPQTRRHARAKLDALGTRVGYPERWRRYEGLKIDRDDLLGNVQRGRQFENAYQLSRLRRRFEPREWLMTPQTVNGYYTPSRNEIVLPAAMLQPPVFDPAADDAANYGAIGAMIGHEISHAFDQRGRQFDAYGRIRDWWTDEDEQQFAVRARLLIGQFNGFSPQPGVSVNGGLTFGENFGDLGGVAIALRAYRLSLDGKPAPVIDGFTGQQRFLIKWAQVWRERVRDEYLRQTLLYSPYAPPQYRTNGVVSNLDAFHEAFEVQPGDRLYRDPKNRVRIW